MNKTILLLKTLLLSTNQWNIYKHTGDKKKRRKIIGSFTEIGCRNIHRKSCNSILGNITDRKIALQDITFSSHV